VVAPFDLVVNIAASLSDAGNEGISDEEERALHYRVVGKSAAKEDTFTAKESIPDFNREKKGENRHCVSSGLCSAFQRRKRKQKKRRPRISKRQNSTKARRLASSSLGTKSKFILSAHTVLEHSPTKILTSLIPHKRNPVKGWIVQVVNWGANNYLSHPAWGFFVLGDCLFELVCSP
jgi:hypothetical protein